MAETSGQEKSEKATGKRRLEARRRGQVALSREVPSALILLTSLGVFYLAGAFVFERLFALLGGTFSSLGTVRLSTVAQATAFALDLFQVIVALLVPFFLPFLVAGFLGNVAQIGLEFHAQSLQPKLAQLNPLAGAKKLLSLRSLVETVKSVLKIVIVGGIAYAVINGHLEEFPPLMRFELVEIWDFACRLVIKLTFYVCLALIVLAALDYFYQRWQYEQSLKMTKQEVKDERKQAEGDPQVKARIRSLQRQAAHQRMMAEVPKADVVITNPTHLAIALRFEPQEMAAPRVVAKGADFLAERIKEVAREHDVPLVENKPLAQALFKVAEIGDFIPVDLYRAVAEVLAYVYRLKGRHRL
jgi:flagellar biosynthetic protein FlhB